jgi:uncharacterized OsmC-like protein
MESKPIELRLQQLEGYAFRVEFGDGIADLVTDEPAPLGAGRGPNPSRLLLAAIANCLAASLTFALRKFRNEPGPLDVRVTGELARNAAGRWRIPRARVELTLAEHPGAHQHLDRILAQFEDFCVVTQSVRDGIDVEVVVRDADGRVIHGDKTFEAGA